MPPSLLGNKFPVISFPSDFELTNPFHYGVNPASMMNPQIMGINHLCPRPGLDYRLQAGLGMKGMNSLMNHPIYGINSMTTLAESLPSYSNLPGDKFPVILTSNRLKKYKLININLKFLLTVNNNLHEFISFFANSNKY